MRAIERSSLCAVLAAGLACAQADWPAYGHDAGQSRYSPLAQIHAGNVAALARAWTYHTGEDARQFESTPLVVDGVLYLSTQNQRVVALEPETGKEIWSFPVNGVSRRGVAYMPGAGSNPPRILFSAGRRLIALNATTGKLDPGFGKEGEVDMVVPYNSVPLIFRNVVVVGANTPPGRLGAPGNARAYDARTGAKLWEFSSIARPGEPGHDTWDGDSWKDRSGANA